VGLCPHDSLPERPTTVSAHSPPPSDSKLKHLITRHASPGKTDKMVGKREAELRGPPTQRPTVFRSEVGADEKWKTDISGEGRIPVLLRDTQVVGICTSDPTARVLRRRRFFGDPAKRQLQAQQFGTRRNAK